MCTCVASRASMDKNVVEVLLSAVTGCIGSGQGNCTFLDINSLVYERCTCMAHHGEGPVPTMGNIAFLGLHHGQAQPASTAEVPQREKFPLLQDHRVSLRCRLHTMSVQGCTLLP